MTLRHVGFTPVPPGARPGFDHADTFVGPDGSRLFVAHTVANRVDVLDCASGAHLRSLDGLPGVAGVLIDSTRDLLFTSDRAVGRVSIFRASDERLISQVAVGPRPNGLAFDPQQGNLFSHLETIATAEGAHTIGWDPATRRLFAFEPARCGVAIFEYAA